MQVWLERMVVRNGCPFLVMDEQVALGTSRPGTLDRSYLRSSFASDLFYICRILTKRPRPISLGCQARLAEELHRASLKVPCDVRILQPSARGNAPGS